MNLRITIEAAGIGVLLAFPLGIALFGLLVLLHAAGRLL